MRTVKFEKVLPSDAVGACLVGRVWDPNSGGPRVVSVDGEDVVDHTGEIQTVSELLELNDPVEYLARSGGEPRWSLQNLIDASLDGDPTSAYLLAPVDVQVIKACGVTFVESMIERFIEERCAGDSTRAEQVRKQVQEALDGSIASLRPGSEAALEAKQVLIAQGMWSQYLEVGIGPDPEVFTKAPVLSSVGFGSRVGIPTFSSWNNPEPELVLVCDSQGKIRGASLGNDVNLRDIEGRSALLLGMAKDNNASSAIGPFIRLFKNDFTLETLRNEEISLHIQGKDGYSLHGSNSISQISRPFEELVNATYGRHHQYPDGFALFTGTLFAPTEDRDSVGLGFTHKPKDVVTITSRHLGTLINITDVAENISPWTFGIRDFIDYITEVTNAQKTTT